MCLRVLKKCNLRRKKKVAKLKKIEESERLTKKNSTSTSISFL